MATESKVEYQDYELVSIPDEDLEKQLDIVKINDIEYFVGTTGNLYHKEDRYIIGNIKDWDGFDDKDNKSVNVVPVVGYKNILKKKK